MGTEKSFSWLYLRSAEKAPRSVETILALAAAARNTKTVAAESPRSFRTGFWGAAVLSHRCKMVGEYVPPACPFSVKSTGHTPAGGANEPALLSVSGSASFALPVRFAAPPLEAFRAQPPASVPSPKSLG